ncbi:helix-turn-helix domain-containing protein [Clostridium butyricum]
MNMSQQHFEEELKHKIVKLHLGGRTIKSLSEEYKVSKASISNWVDIYHRECQTNQEFK